MVEIAPEVILDETALYALCRAHGILRLGVFGSAVHGQLRPDSDIDLLVEFEPGRTPGLLAMSVLELELGELIGRRVDLRTPADLSPYFRDDVTANVRPLYHAA